MSPLSPPPGQRGRGLSLATSVGLGLTLAAGALCAAPAAASPERNVALSALGNAEQSSPARLSRGDLTVSVDPAFPRIVGYEIGARRLDGNPDAVHTVRLNGVDHHPTVTSTSSASSIDYTLDFPDTGGLVMKVSISAEANHRVTWKVTSIDGAAEATVRELSFPGLGLVSVGEGGTLSRTSNATDSAKRNDVHLPITSSVTKDSAPVGSPYAFVAGTDLSAGVITNATPDAAQGSSENGNTRLLTRVARDASGEARASISPGTFTWAALGATDPQQARYELPSATVVLAGDLNADGRQDWQDSAIAQREATPAPLGADRVPERVLQRIPFNIVSEATNPFLKTLDNTKLLATATDGLGQFVLLKGYGSEGHDSANTDYAGHYNERAGGLRDLRTLLKEGDKVNADFYVHVNATEAYTQARSFSDRLIQGQGLGWNWMNQAYGIDQRYDIGGGGAIKRFADLRQEAPELDGVYIDVFYSSGWLATSLAKALSAQGTELATEWSYKHEGNSVWSHWANDKSYGGSSNKGVSSQMTRFMFNAQRDIWNTDPLLGGVDLKDFEGWSAKTDRTAYMRAIWETQLPTKYLQHFQLQGWEDGKSARLSGDVSVEMDNGTRVISQGGAEVLRGDTYLLPWQSNNNSDSVGSPLNADKMYFHSGSAEATTFTLTKRFAGVKNFTVYELGDTGRTNAVKVKARGGKITLAGKANTAYVVVPVGGPKGVQVSYGTGSLVHDPGFTSGTLHDWDHEGEVTVGSNSRGDTFASLGASRRWWDTSVSQEIKGLKPGARYALVAQVQTPAGQARIGAINVNGKDLWEWSDFGPNTAENRVGSDAKHGSYFQRTRLNFTAPKNGKATVKILAGVGQGTVDVDDVRLIELKNLTADSTAPVSTVEGLWDFEDNAPGYGPFVRGVNNGGLGDGQSSISEAHVPFTTKEWKNAHAPYLSGANQGAAIDDVVGGQHSLKLHEESNGTVMRTTPTTLNLRAGHRYRVGFDYQASGQGAWSFLTGADRSTGTSWKPVTVSTTPLAVNNTTQGFTREFTAQCGIAWFGLGKTGGGTGAELVVDNVHIQDLGKDTNATEGCASLQASADSTAPGATSTLTTTFVNNEESAVQRIHVGLSGLPEGYSAKVAERGANVGEELAPGASLRTTWLITSPADANPGDSIDVSASAVYSVSGSDRSSVADTTLRVAERATLPSSLLRASADSEQSTTGGEGPASNAIDGDPSTLWHTSYNGTPAPYPHWLAVDLGGEATVSGLGYQGRQAGGNNGKIKDYQVQISPDGVSWQTIASGTFADTPALQLVNVEPVRAKHVRLLANSALNGQPFAAVAELKVFGTSTASFGGYEPSPRP